MHRPKTLAQPRSICQICESISTQRRRVLAPPIVTRNVSQSAPRPRRGVSSFVASQSRASSSVASPGTKRAPAARSASDTSTRNENEESASSIAGAPGLHSSSIADIMAYLKTSVAKVSATRGIPSEQNVAATLEVCEMLANWFTDEAVQPQIAHTISELESTASTLILLDGDVLATTGVTRANPAVASTARPSQVPEGIEYSSKLHELIDKISETAYLVVAHPPVIITPKLLKQYVKVQAKLGKPETLPKVFQLYAVKPLPREGSTPLRYTAQKPNNAERAIDSEIVDAALDTAIEAKNLDAAVGIIENSYGTKAFVRSKLLRHGLLPLGAFTATPIAAYILATNFSGMQQSMDSGTATNVAFIGILAYLGFTASIGLVAVTTANDQMKRVSWAPGMPLRKRWIREEERAALDKVACAWGFQEVSRQGEEEGADWDALREYIGQKGMMLDRTELMEGMD